MRLLHKPCRLLQDDGCVVEVSEPGGRGDGHRGQGPRALELASSPLPTNESVSFAPRTSSCPRPARKPTLNSVLASGVRSLGTAGLVEPQGCPPAFTHAPIAKKMLYVNVEVIHHGAEICLLRDLYLRNGSDAAT